MQNTRATQPYRAGARQQSGALSAMLRGRTTGNFNPMDLQRQTQMQASGRSNVSPLVQLLLRNRF